MLRHSAEHIVDLVILIRVTGVDPALYRSPQEGDLSLLEKARRSFTEEIKAVLDDYNSISSYLLGADTAPSVLDVGTLQPWEAAP